MAQQLIEAMDRLPELALQKIEEELSSFQIKITEINLQKKEVYLFGHPVKATPIEIQEMELMVKMQTIEDWKIAKDIILEKLTKEAIRPAAIVPTDVFNETLESLRLIDLTGIDPDNGKLAINPMNIDAALLKTFGKGSVDLTKAGYSLGDEIRFIINKSFPGEINYSESIKILHNEDLPELNTEDDSLGSVMFRLNTEDFYNRILYSDKPDDEFIKRESALNQKILDLQDTYHVYKLVHNEFEKNKEGTESESLGYYYGRVSHTLEGKAIFPNLPDEFEKLLITLKTKFPAWPVYTAADPEYFRISYMGIDIKEYAEKRCIFWKKVFEGLKSDYPEVKKSYELNKKSRELNKKLTEELSKIGKLPSKNYILLTEEDLQRAIAIEKDPIFYVPIKQVYKNIEYEMTIVWGQCGESPNEQKAIEKLKSFDSKIFLGSQMN